jgi:hypothetical protein
MKKATSHKTREVAFYSVNFTYRYNSTGTLTIVLSQAKII